MPEIDTPVKLLFRFLAEHDGYEGTGSTLVESLRDLASPMSRQLLPRDEVAWVAELNKARYRLIDWGWTFSPSSEFSGEDPVNIRRFRRTGRRTSGRTAGYGGMERYPRKRAAA